MIKEKLKVYPPFRFADMKDSFIRFPLWKMITRPTQFQPFGLLEPEDERLLLSSFQW